MVSAAKDDADTNIVAAAFSEKSTKQYDLCLRNGHRCTDITNSTGIK